MPVGIQRLNAKRTQPNERIVFIKPLKGPDESVAQDFLERIAAQCLPIMKENCLSVMSLEEYEPNPEFVGRNFNAGEVVQLVLKSRSGRWLPFDYVQMVMMHELAHCKQMNHSKAFWAVRNQYADHMRMLWSRGYTGEGLWGRGAFLGTGAWETNAIRPDEHLPEHLCGGTYRSRGRKRRAKAQPTYQEQKARRILKRFGANGVALGEDARVKRGLEKGRAIGAKPRVAGSKRGRELRAAAALARFGQQKEEEEEEDEEEDKKPKEEDAETESGSEFEDDAADKGTSDAVDINGTKLLDGKGRGMIKVCGDETSEDQDVRNELSELRSSMHHGSGTTSWPQAIKLEPGSGSTRHEQKSKRVDDPKKPELLRNLPPPRRDEDKKQSTTTSTAKEETDVPKDHQAAEAQSSGQKVCPVCSCDNEALSVTCAVCNNVLDPKHVPGTWSCRRTACEGSKYLNAGDCGVCGACGERRAASAR